MRELSPCQACKRHVRVTETTCPFCGAAFAPGVAAEPGRVRGRPGGRAALFLTGAGVLVGACEVAPPENGIPAYGVAVDPSFPPADARAPDARAADGGPASPDAGEPMAQPVYGIPIDAAVGQDASADAAGDAAERDPCAELDAATGDAGDGGDAGDAAACDAGAADAGEPEDDPDGALVQPVYGVAVDAGDPLVQPAYGIAVDAGVHEDDNLAVPIYGIAIEADERE